MQLEVDRVLIVYLECLIMTRRPGASIYQVIQKVMERPSHDFIGQKIGNSLQLRHLITF